MTKLDLLIRAVAALVVGIIFWGIFSPGIMPILTPFILIGTAAVIVLYVVNAFKKRNYAKIITILAVAVFALIIVGYKMFG